MLILFALLLAFGFVALFHQTIKRHPNWFYLIAAAIALAVGFMDGSFLPAAVQKSLLALFTHGAFATAIWIIVMWTGALKNGSKTMKKLMPIRGELSILAAILTFGHNLFYGKTYFVRLFTNARSLPWTQLLAAIFSVVMILLLLPLTITSFPKVRKKMSAKQWKKLQRWAYLYYGLLYAHIMLITMPGALSGKMSSVISVLVYTLIFLSYLCFRVRKYLILRKKANPKTTLTLAVAICVIGLLICGAALWTGNHSDSDAQVPAEDSVQTQPEVGEVGGAIVSGHAYGYDGEVYMTVTVENGVITHIEGYTEESDDFYFNRCYEKVIGAILETQSCDVDAVSGATYSSQAIMDAVASALKQVDQ